MQKKGGATDASTTQKRGIQRIYQRLKKGDSTNVSMTQAVQKMYQRLGGATGVSRIQEGATEHENGVEECVDQLNKLRGDMFVVVEIDLNL